MENLAYLHLTCAYEDKEPPELVPLLKHWQKAIGINWKRLSSLAWRYMLTLTLSLAVVSIAAGAQAALQKGDQNLEVKTLQEQLRKAGFFDAQPTGFYGAVTEAAVKRFQDANGLKADGVAGEATIRKLQQYSSSATNHGETDKPTASKPPASNSAVNEQATSNPNSGITLKRGVRSPQVKTLQEQLRVAGYFFADSSGFYGPVTEAAVKRFQEAHGIKPDGVAGPSTVSKLPSVGVGFGEDETPARPTSTSAPKVSRDNLIKGDRGEDVRRMQQQLKKAGFLEGKIDGVFGTMTEEAVLRFQEANYLATSGVAGPTTLVKLAQVTGSGSSQKVAQSSQPQKHVMELQKRLKERGFYNGPVSGVLGDETQQAIQEAQEYYGVSQDDIKKGRF
jgi:peptidoglycan hydrolase-like protein with peptidoglycan-binding domain